MVGAASLIRGVPDAPSVMHSVVVRTRRFSSSVLARGL
jgi:hypothetical protein